MKKLLLGIVVQVAAFELTWKATHKLLRRFGW